MRLQLERRDWAAVATLDYRDLKVGISVMSPDKSAGVVKDLWMP